MKNKRGFTLMEMLIVVGIIGILAAVSIPVYHGVTERARAATCMANRRSLKAVLTLEEMDNGTGGIEALFQSRKAEFPCPSGGTISYQLMDSGAIIVYCSEHAAGGFDPSGPLIGTLSGITLTPGQRIDSNVSTGAKIQAVKDALQADGIDLDALGVKTWSLVNSNAAGVELVWSETDISDGSAKKVPVICYNQSSNSYTVGYSNVSKDASGYYIVAPSAQKNGYGTDPSNQESAPFASFEEAYTAYQALK